MKELPRALRWYLWAIYVACAILVVAQVTPLIRLLLHWQGYPGALGPALLPAALFTVLALVCEYTALEISDSILQSLSTAVYVAAILLFPPPTPTLIALGAMIFWQKAYPRLPLYKRIFNIGHMTLLVGLNSLLFSLVATPAIALRSTNIVTSIPALAQVLGVYYVLDVGVMLGLFSLLERQTPWRVWSENYRRTLLPELAAASIGILGAVAWLYQPLLLILSVIPVVALRVALRAIAQAQRRGARLEAILAVGQRIGVQQTAVELLHPVIEAARAVTDAAAAAAYLREKDDPNQLTCVAAAGQKPGLGVAPVRAPTHLVTPTPGCSIHEEDAEDGRVLLVPLTVLC